ncbi:hypothetical protein LTR86_010682 [Recurvomyces mirabilis]|nr:hypothetical protein LTR86_010682 [Recurvomyces mirabilis]
MDLANRVEQFLVKKISDHESQNGSLMDRVASDGAKTHTKVWVYLSYSLPFEFQNEVFHNWKAMIDISVLEDMDGATVTMLLKQAHQDIGEIAKLGPTDMDH